MLLEQEKFLFNVLINLKAIGCYVTSDDVEQCAWNLMSIYIFLGKVSKAQ